MLKYFILASALVLFTSSSVLALTIPSGSVLTTDENGSQIVVPGDQTQSALQNLAEEGYHYIGGHLYIQVGDSVVSVNIQNATDARMAEGMIIIAIAEHLGITPEELGRMMDSAEHVKELKEAGVENAVSAAGKTAQEVVDELDLDAVSGAIVGVDEVLHEQIQEIFTEIDNGVVPTKGSHADCVANGGDCPNG